MRIIKRSALVAYAVKHKTAENSLLRWATIVKAAEWTSLDDTRKTFPGADEVTLDSGNVVSIFNIAGNRYRLIVAIHYNRGMVSVRDFMTHAEYSKDRWKERH